MAAQTLDEVLDLMRKSGVAVAFRKRITETLDAAIAESIIDGDTPIDFALTKLGMLTFLVQEALRLIPEDQRIDLIRDQFCIACGRELKGETTCYCH